MTKVIRCHTHLFFEQPSCKVYTHVGSNNFGISGGVPSCCMASVLIAAPCEEIPALPSESWDTLLSDDGDIPVLEVREIGTGSTQIKGYWKC